MTANCCAVIHPNLSPRRGPEDRTIVRRRSAQASLDEAVSLAQAIDLDVVHSEAFELPVPRPSTLLGKGTVERLRQSFDDHPECDLIYVNANLTPVQQQNLENAWDRKVIDRTGIILEIFGARARTGEGRMQVELAALNYQLGRLVRSWTHLERQRGGAGFLGGPGERQIELDRRMIRQSISRLKRQLENVKRTRKLQRGARQRLPYPIIALVGYTNAGKSTLFNRLTGADVFAKDQLFATLDPTMRRYELPSGVPVILSDTVGFISDLPHELVNAFHATLEEVVEADIVLHVRDIADSDTEIQRDDVLAVLSNLGVSDESEKIVIEVLNKTDLLPFEALEALKNQVERKDNRRPILISAATGDGCEALGPAFEKLLGIRCTEIDLVLDHNAGAILTWVYENTQVVERQDEGDGVHLRLNIDAKTHAQLLNRIDSGAQGRLN